MNKPVMFHSALLSRSLAAVFVLSTLSGCFEVPACAQHQGAPVNASQSAIKDKWALVIGIGKFKDQNISTLKFAAKDASDFAAFLTNQENFASDHVLLLSNEQATVRNINKEIGDRWLPNHAQKDDLVLVFASTHGSPSEMDEKVGENFLMAYDTDPNNLFSTGISLQKLAKTIKERTGCKRVLLLLDCCNSGAAVLGGDKSLVRMKNIDVEQLVSDGMIVVSSSDCHQRSWESKRYSNGVFTKHLIDGLSKSGENTGIFEAFASLQENVEKEVKQDRNELQQPQMKSRWTEAELRLAAMPSQPRTLSEDETKTVPAQLELAWKYFNGIGLKQDRVKAIQIYEKLADEGSAEAQYNLGYFYESGEGVPENHAKSVSYFRRAADQGDVNAQYSLAHAYAAGWGVPKDQALAMHWYAKSAEQGNIESQLTLAERYARGEGVRKNFELAAEWYKKAAAQGSASGLVCLGELYQEGMGVPRDYGKAAECYRTAAEQGYAVAQCRLAYLYERGDGVPKDMARSVKLYRQSLLQGHEHAKAQLKRLHKL